MSNFIPVKENILKKAVEIFQTEFQCCPEIAACAPGRVNLIGEHTDYNDGFVLPMALPLVTIIVGRVNETQEVKLYSAANDVDDPHKVQFFLNEEIRTGKPKWSNYLKGVIAKFKESSVPGFDAVIVSSVPVGVGLSSSAALEVATYTFLETLVGKKTNNLTEKARICQEAEHHYANVPCGIMDQLVSILGRENNALLLDCRFLDVTYVPLNDPSIAILITNSNFKHELAEGEYAVRRKQCEKAAKLLGRKSLRDAVASDLLNPPTMSITAKMAKGLDKGLKTKVVDETIIARARHVITENERTTIAATALAEKNYTVFGNLMLESHNSLRDDFEVSCKELDEIVQATIEVDGVFGSRMTGGGFGGCTVTLLKESAVNNCISNIKIRYSGDPVFYVCKPSAAAQSLTINLK